MEIKGFHLPTFLFQIINFFLLLFILSRLLYKPLRSFIEKRRKELAKCFLEAESSRKEAEELKRLYEERLSQLERQRVEILENYKREAELEAQKLIEKAKLEAERLYQREKALLERERERLEAYLEKRIKELTLELLERYLSQLPLPALHEALLKRVLAGISQDLKTLLTEMDLKLITQGELYFAFPFEEPQKIAELIERELGKRISWEFSLDSSLLAGLKVKLNGLVLDYSLRGQLKKLERIFEEK